MDTTFLIVISLIIIFGVLFFKKTQEEFKYRTGYFCPDCSDLKSFAQCYECENCVWCPMHKRCEKGDAFGPYGEKGCNCDQWKHRSDFHRIAGCRRIIKPFKS
uniref:Uncharacterized protein n=1 Tax=viral metagenome TaxID=1070528 RepID=A0A6C0ACB9_9ZZZZ